MKVRKWKLEYSTEVSICIEIADWCLSGRDSTPYHLNRLNLRHHHIVSISAKSRPKCCNLDIISVQSLQQIVCDRLQSNILATLKYGDLRTMYVYCSTSAIQLLLWRCILTFKPNLNILLKDHSKSFPNYIFLLKRQRF